MILNHLETVKFPKNYIRRTATNNSYCRTLTFGKTGYGSNRRSWESVQNIKNEKLYLLLKELAINIDPNFKYTSITVNKNFKSYPHYDSNNAGESMIIALGNYTGGELNIEGVKIDIHDKVCYFDGRNKLHYTEDFEGTRYSIIFFTRP